MLPLLDNILSKEPVTRASETIDASEDSSDGGTGVLNDEVKEDYYYNYKAGEFFIDSIMKLMLNYEKYGNGVGMFIISKLLLPILHALGHSNYSNSIHRFICRVLSSTTPREALKLVWERFSNRSGKVGENIFKDRRVEFRIGILKKLLRNLGPNINTESIKKVNSVIDIKEKLFKHARDVHGVIIRSGAHKERKDVNDYHTIFEMLTETNASEIVLGRKFGDLKFPENLLNLEKFDKAKFYRWVVQKNKEAVAAFRGSQLGSAMPGANMME